MTQMAETDLREENGVSGDLGKGETVIKEGKTEERNRLEEQQILRLTET